MTKESKPVVRVWAPRRKTGCITCKVRRIKCDETKPTCQKCSTTGRKCDGYASDISPNLPVSSSFLNLPISPSLSPAPSLHQPSDLRENRAFDHFITITAPQLSGHFSPKIWLQYVPRLSINQPALRHAVIAIAAIHEGYTRGLQNPERNTHLEAYSFALKHYSLSITNLQEVIATGDSSIEPILSCCALYVVFDSLRGNYAAAATHLKAGMKLLADYLSNTMRNKTESGEQIVRAFTALGLQVGTFIDSVLPDDTTSIWTHIEIINRGFKPRFETVDDARHALNMILNRFMAYHTHRRIQLESQNTATHTTSINTTLPDILQDLTRWSRSLDAIILKPRANLSATALKGSVLLQVHHASLSLLVHTAVLEASGFSHFNSTSLYGKIVSLSRTLIVGDTASISSDLGLIGPLFATVSRCTDRRIRCEALELLRGVPRREGMWDADVLVRITSGMLEIEERSDEDERQKIVAVRVTSDEDKIGELADKVVVDLDYDRTDSAGRRVVGTKRV
ncbi:Zn2/Cys6 DNA-binding protein [Glarea lozoyensis ATCC 20868]|uniref:Zn2/Cys6 DNA-binding protein n=1 Tax=Glarea lozoyensis (strain ATCC 20868 / MF5171) TaxID=1116229 RepID=S3DBF3_GLAL2|nr:Zn2/Cys6 DNA-binding protein [Glarea lozoyensis ATCC 20868]EPE34444.1 Zn2/Cys6 DNA-binding protein [Glarea lozoyensis ATCC 20868]